MWGGIYAVLFSVATIISAEDPIKSGFPYKSSRAFEKFTFSKVEFQNNMVGRISNRITEAAKSLELSLGLKSAELSLSMLF